MNDVVSYLLNAGVLDPASAARARSRLEAGEAPDEVLRDALPVNGDGKASEDPLLRALADHFHVPFLELEKVEAPPKTLLNRFPASLLLAQGIMPIADADGTVLVATSRLFDTSGLDELRLAMGIEVSPALATSVDIERFAKRCLGLGADTLQSMDADSDVTVVEEGEEELDLGSATAAAQDASIIKFVNQVLTEALERRATDVHVEPFEDQLRVRYRVDGILVEANIPSQVRKYQAAIVSRLKILSHLDIAEKRLPQDGRIRLKVGGREIDLRVSVIPMLHGEAVVLRILDRGDTMMGLENLGMSRRDRTAWDRILELPHGIVLVTGPTGSGKTTSLYAALTCINDVERKIITIEDPVEYQLRGINQIQISTKTGLTFARGLRAILRHDPDVVLIGEIRDRETAEIAVQASLTGHLVFSTLHTNDAPSATTRLIDMGIEPYLVASTLEMVVAQRLVRLICQKCKAPDTDLDIHALREEYGSAVPDVLYRGRGCRECQGSGYRGRQGVFELMPITEEIRSLILERTSSGRIRKTALEQGMNSLRGDGWRLVGEGRTTIEEVIRVTKNESISVAAEALSVDATA